MVCRKETIVQIERGGGKTLLVIISILLTATLIGLLYYDQIEQRKNSEKLSQIAGEQQEEFNKVMKKIEDAYESVKQTIEMTIPGIVCWGDSLTAGAGGDGVTYPMVLSQLLDGKLVRTIQLSRVIDYKIPDQYSYAVFEKEKHLPVPPVVNMGVGGENTNTILGRSGAIPFIVSKGFTIPEGSNMVDISFISANGKAVAPLRQGISGMESVTIGGIEGEIGIVQESSTSSDFSYYFTRSGNGKAVYIKEGTEIITEGSNKYRNYLPIIFIGQNGGYDDINELIEQQKAIISHHTDNREKYIILGLHTGTAESRRELESAMLSEYGNRYINLREYLSTEGMEKAGLKASEKDLEMMADGMVPASLLHEDLVHFNAEGYKLIGNIIYERMLELDYFKEVIKYTE